LFILKIKQSDPISHILVKTHILTTYFQFSISCSIQICFFTRSRKKCFYEYYF